jgi:benzoate/toluate 1,2-dioxygenase beta subunit
MTTALRHDVAGFLYHEARLMDESRYSEWLDLWAPDALYWVPCDGDDGDPRNRISLIYDNRARIEDRVFRLNSSSAHSQDPPSRMCRIVGNVQVLSGEASPDSRAEEMTVESSFVLVEVRRGDKNVYAGRTIHRLRPDGAGLRIVSKKVVLVDNDQYLGNLTFLL